jgi:hypothetical protein
MCLKDFNDSKTAKLPLFHLQKKITEIDSNSVYFVIVKCPILCSAKMFFFRSRIVDVCSPPG